MAAELVGSPSFIRLKLPALNGSVYSGYTFDQPGAYVGLVTVVSSKQKQISQFPFSAGTSPSSPWNNSSQAGEAEIPPGQLFCPYNLG